MKRNLLKPGDFSLTLEYPEDVDTNTYTCTISSKGNILMKKHVLLHVRGQKNLVLYCIFNTVIFGDIWWAKIRRAA